MKWLPLALAFSSSLFLSSVALADATDPPAGGAEPSVYPSAIVQRPLTLPKLMLAPELSVSLTHLEVTNFIGPNYAVNAVGMNLGASFGVTDDVTVYLVPLTMVISGTTLPTSTTKVYYGTFRAGAVFRFFHSDVVELGAQAEFGADGAYEGIFLTARLPVLFHLGKFVRLDTGVAFTGVFPTTGSRPVDAGLASLRSGVGGFAATSGAGIPLTLTIQPEEHVFFGLDTGFGIGSFRGKVSDSTFMPLGGFVGTTIVGAKHDALADIVASFSFPAFLLGNYPNPPATELWQIGLGGRVYLPL